MLPKNDSSILGEHIIEWTWTWGGGGGSLLMTRRRIWTWSDGHVVSQGGPEKLVLGGKINGIRQRGGRRFNSMEGHAWAAGCGAVEALRQAGYWIDFRGMVANLSPWQSTEEDDSKEDFSVWCNVRRNSDTIKSDSYSFLCSAQRYLKTDCTSPS